MTDRGEENLRRLFRLLPRAGAPPEFEDRLARAIAGRASGSSRVFRGIRALALPGAALLAVGVIAYLVFRGGPETGGGFGVPPSEQGSAPAVPDDATGRPPSSTQGDVAPEGVAKEAVPSPAATPSPPLPDAKMKLGKTGRSRTLMMERATPEAGAADDSTADSLGRRDSLRLQDSLRLRDSLRVDSARALPDSIPPPNRGPGRE